MLMGKGKNFSGVRVQVYICVCKREREKERARRRAQVTAAYAKHSENIHSAFGEQGTRYALGIQFRLWLKAMSWLCVWLCMSGSVCSLHLSFFFVFFFLDAPLKQYSGGSGWPSCTPPHLCPPLSLQQHAPRRCVSACLCRPGRRCKSHHDSVSHPSLSIRGVSYTKSAPLLIGIFFKKKTTTFQRQWL